MLIAKQDITKPVLKNLVRTVKTHKGFSKQKGSVAQTLHYFYFPKYFNSVKNKREPTFTGPLQVWPMVYILYQGPMITVEADVTKTLNEKICREQTIKQRTNKREPTFTGPLQLLISNQ